jgi:hypothetical protein
VTRLPSRPVLRPAAPSLCRAPPIVALIVLVANDHVLKGSALAPAWLTGKLSDVAGLFLFPILLTALLGDRP